MTDYVYEGPREPQDDAEREALIFALCGRYLEDSGYVCTRGPGHEGDHVAGGFTHVHARWAQ